ncbi:MAG: hypothetical protein V4710_15855, partial [Verrucomicrobiota bacterium]
VAAAGAIWLPDDPYVLKRHNHAVMAFAALEAWPHPNQALPIVAVLHDPAHYWRVQKQGAALAMAGHLHGGQMVWTRNNAGRLLPAGWIYRLNVLRFKHAQCELVVSRGCADTLPVRWRCPREVVLCELEPGLE